MHPACYLGPKRKVACRFGTGVCRHPSASALPACVRAGSVGTSKRVSVEVLCFGFVPENHLLQLIDRHVSFDFVRKKPRDTYSDTGRPSIDPEVLLRILVIGFCTASPANASWLSSCACPGAGYRAR